MALRYFPLFADLRGRRVLVVGGGEVAERKIRLLLDAQARVEIVAPELTEWLAARLASPESICDMDDGGSLAWLAGHFEDGRLDGVTLVVAATSDPAVNAQVASAARRRGLLANVVDDAEQSGFIVPAIVDRSPLVIAVSSGGVAPVLARLVRAKIESLIDGSFGALAALLGRWRSRIKAARPDLPARRRLYASLIEGEVAAQLRRGRAAQAERALFRALSEPSSPNIGSVTLVGAGPGDPGLLTLNALRALQGADVVLHDRLVSAEVIALARRDATIIEVGKEARGHSVAQEQIHALMLEHARAGWRVVRLKGGDPFIFGRGGEELEFLKEHGVPFEVVPGITAATACGAYAGIPLTHRAHAQSVRFATAHGTDSLDTLDWAGLAQDRQTLALYMGVAALPSIGERLIARGRRADTPVAVVENGTRPEQRVTLSTLGSLAELSRHGGIRSPALIIVGEVASLGATLHWFGREPRCWEALRDVA